MDGKTVEYLMSGSDMVSFGNYTQSGNQIKIGDGISFTASSDGSSLIYSNHIAFRTEKTGYT